jgi:thiamine pyrophosphate-dependent acetolactate synthase large subunit-like protein
MTLTGQRLIAEMLHGYGVSHVFFVPTILTPALAAGEPASQASLSPAADSLDVAAALDTLAHAEQPVMVSAGGVTV